MYLTNVIKCAGLIIGTIVMVVGFWGCQTGGLVASERQIPLVEGGPHTGNTNVGGAVVEYQYTLNSTTPPGGTLAIRGKILSAPADSIQVNIYVLAVDAQSKELAKDVMYASGYNNRYASRNPTFEETYKLPMGTVAIAFDSLIQASRGER
jgi:hypothetical protein